jgi:RNA ligase (TIGR02306 family)
MRKLASIQKIENLRPIEGADKIELASILGWEVVVQKGLHENGNLVCYLEIDSWTPHSLVDLSRGGTVREFNGVPGNRLKTIKLRGQISQGMCLPLSDLTQYFDINSVSEGDDVTDQLGIQKYEKPIEPHLQGLARGNFPSWLRKTDQDRIQNVYGKIKDRLTEQWVIEEKLDGSSMTVGYNEDGVVVCSRNLSLKLEGNEENTFVKTATDSGILTALEKYGRNLGISGELIGNKIQGGRYFINEYRWYVFDILDVDAQKYVSFEERNKILNDLRDLGATIYQTPVITTTLNLNELSVKDLLILAEGKSVLSQKTEREGLVFKNQNDPDLSFKAISNKFLLKGGE